MEEKRIEQSEKPKKWRKRILWGTLIFLVLLVGWSFLFLPALADRLINRVRHKSPYKIDPGIQKKYQKIPFIADLHGDSLLWKRNFLKRHNYGHIDLPRMIEANVGLQVLSMVTKSPFGQNEVSTDGDRPDMVTLITFFQGWPMKTWGSLFERGLHQAKRLQQYSQASKGQLTFVRWKEDLEAFLKRREKNRKITATLLAMEGAHLLEGKLENLERMYKEGVRMIATTHFFDNRLGGSAHGLKKGGLTPFGRKVIKRMQELGILIDLAHVSAKSIDEILTITKGPVVVSHTGVRGTCPNDRNLSDAQIKAIAKRGGLIGLGLWDKASCGKDAAATVRAMRYVKKLVGIEHVGLGSDFDGAVHAVFDITGLPILMKAMSDAGFTEKEIHLVMGGNFLRLLKKHLPSRKQK